MCEYETLQSLFLSPLSLSLLSSLSEYVIPTPPLVARVFRRFNTRPRFAASAALVLPVVQPWLPGVAGLACSAACCFVIAVTPVVVVGALSCLYGYLAESELTRLARPLV
jgi:hypothetical protein